MLTIEITAKFPEQTRSFLSFRYSRKHAGLSVSTLSLALCDSIENVIKCGFFMWKGQIWRLVMIWLVSGEGVGSWANLQTGGTDRHPLRLLYLLAFCSVFVSIAARGSNKEKPNVLVEWLQWLAIRTIECTIGACCGIATKGTVHCLGSVTSQSLEQYCRHGDGVSSPLAVTLATTRHRAIGQGLFKWSVDLPLPSLE